ncbi:DUF2993 domain-containing protein [Lyngbya sp. CCY1209]|uniref:LmeA family phospholipid-binding protein n=1 Tax=Lyngbya sp. CCY1209 TaxID=2886103 RepID=UPI002D200D2C|nr:DUF2993 domain-containing protein [Lyngbya sp. CCY1209]
MNASEFGEQTLNQIAKVALSSQLDRAEELDVRVQTDPGKLVSGQLDSFFVNGSGLVIRSDVRMESFEVRVRNFGGRTPHGPRRRFTIVPERPGNRKYHPSRGEPQPRVRLRNFSTTCGRGNSTCRRSPNSPNSTIRIK